MLLKPHRPVLHHFFLEAFPDPGRWFHARTTYSRTTALNSMAAYVIGLGDRHSGEPNTRRRVMSWGGASWRVGSWRVTSSDSATATQVSRLQ